MPPRSTRRATPPPVAQAQGAIARSGNVSELALRIGRSREGLYRAISADGNPSFAAITKVAKALGGERISADEVHRVALAELADAVAAVVPDATAWA